jgi:hypothetical protein
MRRFAIFVRTERVVSVATFSRKVRTRRVWYRMGVLRAASDLHAVKLYFETMPREKPVLGMDGTPIAKKVLKKRELRAVAERDG